jgi:hypothetical protein
LQQKKKACESNKGISEILKKNKRHILTQKKTMSPDLNSGATAGRQN